MQLGKCLAQARGDALLVLGVAEGEEQADRHRLGVGASQPIDQAGDLILGQPLDHALGADPLRGLEPQAGVDQRARLRAAGVVEARAVLAADLEEIGEATGRDQRGARAALLQQGVGADRHAVGERLDVDRLGLGAAQHLLHGGDHPARLILGRARHLRRVQALAVEQRSVGEGSTDVDAEQHRANLSGGMRPLQGVCAAPDPPGGRAHTYPGNYAAATSASRTSKVSSRCLCEGQ